MRRREETEKETEKDTMRRWGPSDILSAPENRTVVLKLVRHMIAVALGPIGTYVLVRDLLTTKNRDTIAAVAAVIVLNLLIALYVVIAFHEPDGPPSHTVHRIGRWAEPRAD